MLESINTYYLNFLYMYTLQYLAVSQHIQL